MTLKIAVLSFDVEQDCPPYLSSTRGMERGLPRILDLLAEERVKATFFFTAEMAQLFPRLARRVVDEGHELGSHGYMHERLDKLSLFEASYLLEKATAVLSRFGMVRSFRAPNLQLPDELLPVLEKLGYSVDSSLARYKPPFPRVVRRVGRIVRIPVSVTSSVLRLPWLLQQFIHKRLTPPLVYFAHPWEYVDMRNELVRFDCRFNTGDAALELLRKLIVLLRREGYTIVTLCEAARLLGYEVNC
ncbi:putative polysaccharide deacetylase [Pyrodictium delaneyi]|uniref:Putative polysaccharide deacetylase n=1 Tax=Pyrodictium delaneyi TaxID=1273541 RepID=A0A0P0N3L6_9CREN|nr:polysaccharide deacetylase family protein [Pyrodictium delaneyi]ALL01207.1 putative polysaccharide deacetylase [Pyrodictium delaneyi]